MEVPLGWVGQEVRLIWNSNSEALVWVDGQPRQVSSINIKFDSVCMECSVVGLFPLQPSLSPSPFVIVLTLLGIPSELDKLTASVGQMM